MTARPFTVAMVAAMPYPMAKASCIRVGHIVRSLVEQHDDVSVKVFAYQGSESPAALARVDLRLVAGFDADKARYYSWSNKLLSDAKLVRALCKERRAIDIIHCHTIEGLGIALAFKLVTGSRVPVCVDVHGPIVDELVHYRLIPNWRPLVRASAALERAMLRRVGRAFVSNEGLKRYLDGRMDPARVSVVFDYVDLSMFGAHRLDQARVTQLRDRYKANGEKLITFLGMFKDYQGGDYLLKAFARLAPQYPHARLLLVGDGPCRAQYDEIIRDAGIADRVVLPGLVPHRDVVNWLQVSDVVVSPRVDNEITRAGFVSQLPEYMAMNKLTVATAVSGCAYLLRNGAGILVQPNDVEALRSGLERALDLPGAAAAEITARARENVGQFTWQQGIGEVYRVYRALLMRLNGKDVVANSDSHRDAA